ncbi:hypothetical protein [Rhizobium leguminosarum]|uniref:hypothetical protein n=1 Tax=Rhizobium leguminosarum TaxID=384 RepID=UPI002E13CAD9|nr:hypothetical protein U8Q02_38970 [Rhizobium leguminosarum]
MNLMASVEGDDGQDFGTVSRRIERMCASVLPSSEWGIVFHGPRMGADGELLVEVEIGDVHDLEEASDRFDAFREAVRPGEEFGVTFWNLRERETAAPSL